MDTISGNQLISKLGLQCGENTVQIFVRGGCVVKIYHGEHVANFGLQKTLSEAQPEASETAGGQWTAGGQ